MRTVRYCILGGGCVLILLVIVVSAMIKAHGDRDVGSRRGTTRRSAQVTGAGDLANGVLVNDGPPAAVPSADKQDHRAEREPEAGPRGQRDVRVVSRPEDRGKDLSQLGTGDLIDRLSQSKDPVQLRKAARALGDRSIAGTLSPSEHDKVAINSVVEYWLQQTMSRDPSERVEVRQQVERLWWIAAPALLANIDSRDGAKAETAIKSLVLMRNEDIIRSLMKTATEASDPRTRARAIFALGKMTEKRESMIPGRTCMSDGASKALADTLLLPFLDGLTKTERNTVALDAVSHAIRDLSLAAERRLVPEAGKVQSSSGQR